jgi:DNA/RNA endonuclease G (NUC1)
MRAYRTLLALLLLSTMLLMTIPVSAQPVSRHLALGNPSGAVSDVSRPDNYLIVRDQYALSYHRDQGIPNWVAWHLEATDLGDTPRYTGRFLSDTSLPNGWYQVSHDDYTGSGYDRGHMTPSADRSATSRDNQATFLLTNVLPQAPANNQGLWADLEGYARTLVTAGNELYTVAGGSGSLGTLAAGRLNIPANLWKVILILPSAPGDDVARVTAETQVIALWTPNDATVTGRSWQEYQTSVRCIEQRTGLDLFSGLDDGVEATLAGADCPSTAPSGRCFPETGYCIDGAIRTYWERNGGLAVFGFPLTPQSNERVEGRSLQAQWFERDRLEIQPDGLVTAGRLGVERMEQLGAPWRPGVAPPPAPGCASFAETGYQVCGPFLTYWRNNGGLERFGFPVTGMFSTELEGRTYTVQYFERRRFELHPEIGPNSVLLGLLGREVLLARQAPPTPVTPVVGDCSSTPNPAAAPNFPVVIVAIDKRAETVTLRNVSGEVVNLDGWKMCSLTGSQEHPVAGALAPGETRSFAGPAGAIWNNSQDDPGALYDAQSRLVSYFP